MTPQARNDLLSRTIGEFDYVISRAPADFVLLPEILTKRGENLLRLRRTQEAVSTLLRAIETKPNYWPPYAVLSDYYKQNGELDRAREWLEKGNAASPDAKALEIRQLELKNTPPHSASTATKNATPESKAKVPASEEASE